MAFGSHVAGSVPIFIVIVAIAILVCVRAVFLLVVSLGCVLAIASGTAALTTVMLSWFWGWC